MIRCVRLFSKADGDSHYEDGFIDMPINDRGDVLSKLFEAASISFRETKAGGQFEWHDAPTRQFVLTLSGTLEFEMKSGAKVTIHPGDILLAEDTAGTGHRWRIVDNNPWRRAYVVLKDDSTPIFIPNNS
jgi:quercetin dioxygenase-like cupin family protein